MSVPPHGRVFWIGSGTPGALGQVPYGTEVEVVREKENNKFAVKIKRPTPSVPAQTFDAFREELFFE